MPLYDCLLLMKSHVEKKAMMDLVARIGQRVYQRNGVITDLMSFGSVRLGYGIKKLDGRHYEGQLVQMSMMVPPTFNKELHYLNKEDRLLRWLVVKHRDTKYGRESINEDDGKEELSLFRSRGLYGQEDGKEDDDDYIDDEDDDAGNEDDEKYVVN